MENLKIMKHIKIIALICLGFIQNAVAQAKPDFRNFNWGDSFQKVLSGESAQYILKDNDDMLQYKDQLGGFDCDVMYAFNENDKLVSGNYRFTKKYMNMQLYVQDYNSFKALLTQKYGNPGLDQQNWSSKPGAGASESVGQAIANGNLSLRAEWVSNRSIIEIMLSRVANQPLLQIYYTAKTLNEMENKALMQKALIKL